MQFFPDEMSWVGRNTWRKAQHQFHGWYLIHRDEDEVIFQHRAVPCETVIVKYHPEDDHIVRISQMTMGEDDAAPEIAMVGAYVYNRPDRFEARGGAYRAGDQIRGLLQGPQAGLARALSHRFLPERYQDAPADWVTIEFVKLCMLARTERYRDPYRTW